jgi:AcrR family transcriptional regulator
VVVRANVGRSTFYEHYKTKHDLLAQSFALPFRTLASIIDSKEPPATLIPLLQHFRQNQALGSELFWSQPTRLLMRRVLTGHIEAKLADLRLARPDACPVIAPALIAVQLAEAQLTLVQFWAVDRGLCEVDQIATALCVGCYALMQALLGITGQTPTP